MFELANLELNIFEISIRWPEAIIWRVRHLVPTALGGNITIEAGPYLAGTGHKVAVVNFELNRLKLAGLDLAVLELEYFKLLKFAGLKFDIFETSIHRSRVTLRELSYPFGCVLPHSLVQLVRL